MVDREYGIYKKDVGELKKSNKRFIVPSKKENELKAGDVHCCFPAHIQQREYHMTPPSWPQLSKPEMSPPAPPTQSPSLLETWN